ncbi:MAG: hypothetical protein M1831_000473 [Alyxoria varia]|nr:MAG: hypothetical protein M1831_000473 [Alyxoria varia]
MHQVLVNLSGVDRLMSQSYHTVNAEPFQYTLLTRVFGAMDTTELKTKLENSWKDLLGPIERMFLNDAGAAAAIDRADVLRKAASFVTFSSNAEHMQRWELSADIRIVTTPKSNGDEVPSSDQREQQAAGEGAGAASIAVEANLQSLTRDFGACIAIPLLYGRDFLNRYPTLLDDFWKFDNDVFPLLMIGIPPWAPFKIMKEGVAARSRLAAQMDALYRRIDQYQWGRPVDFDADMSDISNTALDRNKIYSREQWSSRHRGEGDLAILWGQNANTHPTLFWFLTYVYSTPDLVQKLREEISPHTRSSSPTRTTTTTGEEEEKTPSSHHQHHPVVEITSMDFAAISRDCPLLKSCIFETYRLAIDVASIRYVARPITINDGAYKHNLKPGMFVSAPHSLMQKDPSIYADPEKFVPDRFLMVDPGTGKRVARNGGAECGGPGQETSSTPLKPWGSGAAMCKGRTFAEKQIMALGAAIISLWDISPAGGGAWELPAMVPGTGVKKPVADIRVVITRRKTS